MKFTLTYDKRSRYLTIFFIVLLAALITIAFYTSGGSYFPAWLTTLALSIILLGLLSIPRSVVLTPFSIEINCLLEVTRISYQDIAKVKILDKKDMNWCIPFFGIYGVFGYYGYYIDLKRMHTFKLYARRWNDFVLIEDKFQHSVVVSVEDRDTFISQLDLIKK